MLNSVSTLAGSLDEKFDSDITGRINVYGDNPAPWVATGGNPATGGFLALTYCVGYQEATIIFPDLDPGKVVTAFKFECDLRIGNPQSGTRPADGFSISFARAGDPVLVLADTDPVRGFAGDTMSGFAGGEAAPMPETGTSTGIALSFDTWSGNPLPDGADIEGILVRVDNKTVLRQSMPTRNGALTDTTSLQTGPRDTAYWGGGGDAYAPGAWAGLGWAHLSVEVDDQAKLTVIYKDRTLLDKYQTTYFPSPGQLVFGGRTGGANENTHVDNLKLTTTALVTDIEPPTAPTNLKAAELGARRVKLTWGAATDNSGRVAYQLEKDGTVLPAFLTATEYIDTVVNPNTQHTYRVRATDVAQNTSAWASVTVTTVGEVPTMFFLLGEIYDSISGTPVQNLYDDPKFPASPDRAVYLNGISFGEPSFGNTFGENFGIRIAGVLTVPVTGQYDFFVRSDDASQFFLNQAGAAIPVVGVDSPIAEETGCCAAFQDDPAAEETTDVPISLQAGRQYGFVFIVKEGGGGDWGQVAMRKVGDPTPASQLQPIQGGLVSGGKADPVGAVAQITENPQDATVTANTPVTFTATAQTASPYTSAVAYQWYRNGVVIPGANSDTYTIPYVPQSDNGAKFKVTVAVPGASATSTEATLTVTADTTPPTIVSVAGNSTFTMLIVTFSEPVTEASANAVANYAVSGGVTVTSATRQADMTKVVLVTSRQTPGTKYTLTVNNVADNSGNKVAANSTKEFTGFTLVPGFATLEFFDGIGGTSVPNLTDSTKYQNNMPDRVSANSAFETPTWENGTDYGGRISAIVTAPETGNYVFHITSDDSSELWMSTDDNPANLIPAAIAYLTGWSNQRAWSDSDSVPSDPIALVAGKKYYMFAIWKEGGGGDGASVGWELPSAPGTIAVIPASAIATYANVDLSVVNISQQPKAASVTESRTAVFAVAATGSSTLGPNVTYQWQKNGVNIAGATKPSYTTPKLTLADNGAKFRCVVAVPGKAVNSDEVTLTVIPDTFPPLIQAAGAVKKGASYDVGVQFDEELDAASAGTAANYTLSAGTITAVKYYPKSAGVVLSASGLTQGNKYTVTVKNVADLKGNKITSVSKEFTAGKMEWGVVGAGELGLGAGVVAVAENGFDIYSDGIAEWATYDEATFVFEQVTGNFDKKLRVEYQDPSSHWARAGLIARDVTNFGVDRDTQATQAGRYQKVHVNPTTKYDDTAGNNMWETNRRLETGVATTSANSGGTPAYPTAWCRLQRVGQTFYMFRSNDGQTWTSLGSSTFDPAMPDTLYVGPEFAPENGNIAEDSGKRAMFLAKFRDYGDTSPPITPVAKRDYSIGLNFAAEEYPNSPDAGTLAATAIAGVPGIRQANWNNIRGASGTAADIVADAKGTAQNTTVTVVFASNNTWSSTGRGEENNQFVDAADKALMTGYLDTGSATTTTVTINNLPPQLTAGGYDVYVYLLGGIGDGRGGGYRVLDAATGSVLNDYAYVTGPANPTIHTPVPDVTGPENYGSGTYIVFSGLSAASITVEATTAGGKGVGSVPRAPINAIQLVAPTIAPPVTAPMLGLLRTPTGITLTFEGTLQSADAITGPWTDVVGSSPLTVAPTAAQKFYRAKR
jgi:hypothetical protein